MPGRTAYDEGTPNWVELRTPEPEAARSFYGRLFGWTFGERPTSHEARAVKNGGFVAAIASGPDAPATWNTYLNVADVDAAAARVEQGGGTLLTPPQDAGGEARVAFAADPAGATFGLWQAGAHIGATVVNEEGAFIWSELMTAGRDLALPFYERVAGLTARTVDLDGSPFTGFVAGEQMIGGIIPPQREGAVHRWIVYFAVTDAAEVAERAGELGGTVVRGPVVTPVGPIAALLDPQGGAFSVWEFSGTTK
jgi:predicted enzyme related to lactoylglutathione lyase